MQPKIGNFRKNDEFPKIFEWKGRSVGSERFLNDSDEKNDAERWGQIQNPFENIDLMVGRR